VEGVVTQTVLSGSGHAIKVYRISIVGDGFLKSVEDGITRAHGSQPRVLSKKFNVWIPLPIVRRALPYLVRTDDKVASAPVSNQIQIYECIHFHNLGLFQAQSAAASTSETDSDVEDHNASDVVDFTGDGEPGRVQIHVAVASASSDIIDLTVDEDIDVAGHYAGGVINLTGESSSEAEEVA
jgi:hypothetical protein